MSLRMNLNGDGWRVCGWYINEWGLTRPMESGVESAPTIDWIPATVPGAVQVDLMREGIMPDPNYGRDSMLGEWVTNRDWIYEKRFTLAEDFRGERYLLHFDGLDYWGEIWLNGRKLTDFSGMFVPVELDITQWLNVTGENILTVIFYHPPQGACFGYTSQWQEHKSRFNYVWDWCPRIVPIGIWSDVILEAVGTARIDDFFPSGDAQGRLRLQTTVSPALSGAYTLRYELEGYGLRRELAVTESLRACPNELQHGMDVEGVRLWWPHGHGEQPLYTVAVTLLDAAGRALDTIRKRVGFRTVAFVHNPGALPETLPYTLTVNGKRIFIRGVNWVPISPFYGAVRREDYEHNLARFQQMNCNYLRVWGGAILETEDFYDVCDELGLMVWQEFPQSSSGIENVPSNDPAVLKKLREIAIWYIRKRRHHASLAAWGGGNELQYPEAVPVDQHHPNLWMLKQVVETHDPGRHFYPTSAYGVNQVPTVEQMAGGNAQDAHGYWNFLGVPEHYDYYNGDNALFRSETGTPGSARLEALEQFRGSCKLWPPTTANPYYNHRGAWWVQLEQLTQLYGPWTEAELPAYVTASRYLQLESLRYCCEGTRRREPFASGFIIWMGNEPFPNSANTSVLEYDGTPKPVVGALKRCFGPCFASARYATLAFAPGSLFQAEIWLHSDELPRDCTVRAELCTATGEVLHNETFAVRAQEPAQRLGTIEKRVEEWPYGAFFLRLTVERAGEPAAVNTYAFTTNPEVPLGALRNLPQGEVILEAEGEHFRLRNAGRTAAVGVHLYGKDARRFIAVSDTGLTLMPGESQVVQAVAADGEPVAAADLAIEMLNCSR